MKTLEDNLETPNPDFWDELSENDKAEIKEGIEDIESGRIYSYQEIFSKYEL
jgi:predicted transcriptional regulator